MPALAKWFALVPDILTLVIVCTIVDPSFAQMYGTTATFSNQITVLTGQRRWWRDREAAAGARNLYGSQRGDATRYLRPKNKSPEGALTCTVNVRMI